MPPVVIDLTNLAASDGFIIQGDALYDQAGRAVSSAGDVNGDGIDDIIVGAPNLNSLSGRAYVIFGRDSATRSNIDLTNLAAGDGFSISGQAGLREYAGISLSAAGDINGDGLDDIVIGAGGASGPGGSSASGRAIVIFGVSGATRANIDATALASTDGFIIAAPTLFDGANVGYSVSNAGDVNGDGFDDLIIGARKFTFDNVRTGGAFVIFGTADATRANIDVNTLMPADGFVIQGDAANDRAGRSVSSAGDVNGDGIDDLIVGAYGSDDGGLYAGEAYVIYGKTGSTRGTIDLTTLAASDGFVIQGDAAFDQAGVSVSNAGDVNGDGIDDLIVGARYGSDGGTYAGEAYVIYGKTGSTRGTIDLTNLAVSDGFIIQGDTAGDGAGFSVSNAGDFNGDGIDDLIVGARRGDDGGYSAGEAYVIFGKSGNTRGRIDLTNLTRSDGLIIQGDTAGDQAGYSVSAAGDVNGDGIDDVIVGAPHGDNGGDRAGEAYVIYGSRSFGPQPPINGTTGNDTLTGTADADTINGGEGNDVLDGGAGADALNGGAGNDIFIVDDAGDVVTEGSGEGTDSVETALAAYVLTDNVENLEYTGAGAFTGTGNDLANTIVGGAVGDTLGGGAGDDTLGGEAGDDVLNGGDGADRLIGGTGADIMNGGAGNDVLVVDNAGDVTNGGDGVDTVQIVTAGLTYTIGSDVETISNVSGGALDVTLNALANTYGGSAGVDTVFAGAGNDMIYGRGGNDILFGEDGTDRLFGEAGFDTLVGGAGNDLLYGGADGDDLRGEAGNDTLYGEAGNDLFFGGAGLDIMSGGLGADTYRFDSGDTGSTIATADRITDFSSAQGDRIDISGAGSFSAFIGSAAFSNTAGEVRTQVIGGNTYIMGDANGDGIADLMIRLNGTVTVGANDILLID